MKSLQNLFALSVFLSWVTCSTAANSNELGGLLAQPEASIDVGIAALTLAREFYPDIDIAAYSAKIDALADKVRWLNKNSHDPELRIRALNTVLFRQEGFRYDRNPLARAKQEYYFLNGILDSRQGICYTMPLLYVAVAQRLGYPIYPVAAPDHVFVRYADVAFKEQNIEVTSGGKYFKDEWYIEDFSITKAGLRSGSYLRTLSYREFLGYMISANALFYAYQGNLGKSIRYFELAVKLNPKFADNYANMSAVYYQKSQALQGEAAARCLEEAKKFRLKAVELGFVDEAAVVAGRRVRGN